MKKQIGVMVSALCLSAFALVWADNMDSSNSCEKLCISESQSTTYMAKQCEPCGRPANKCEPCGQPAGKCRYGNNAELNCNDCVKVRARNPNTCILGNEYPLCVDIEACQDVCDVVITTTLPEGVTYMKSEPPAQMQGDKLVWNIGSMKKCECKTAKIWLRCDREGEICTCFCATATPVRFCSLFCAKPRLECNICGPQEVTLCCSANYTIVVRNCGTCPAEGVVVTNTVPDGMEHCGGKRSLCYRIGTLCPGEKKTINTCFKAVKRGNACTSVDVSSCNASSVSCQACTAVTICKGTITKTGPDVMEMGKHAEYLITVNNPGDKPLTQVCVTDCVSSPLSIVAAPGATICNKQACWKIARLNPGEQKTFSITLTTCCVGCFTNRVNLTNCEGCNDCAQVTTRWKGKPALNVCVCDTCDPICVGDRVSYCINVTNQGTEADHNVKVVVRFPPEVSPVSASGSSKGTVTGQTVTFTPCNTLNPKQTVRYRINACGKAAGDARVMVEVSSDSIQTPIIQQESTIIQ